MKGDAKCRDSSRNKGTQNAFKPPIATRAGGKSAYRTYNVGTAGSPQSRCVTGPNSGAARIASMWSVVSPALRNPCRWPAGTISDCPAVRAARSSPIQNLRATSKHGQHLLDRMQMRRRAAAGIAPLLEDAQLRRTCLSRDAHARVDARPPLLPFLPRMFNDAHDVPLSNRRARPLAADCGRAAVDPALAGAPVRPSTPQSRFPASPSRSLRRRRPRGRRPRR